jgi:hypothetical protein
MWCPNRILLFGKTFRIFNRNLLKPFQSVFLRRCSKFKINRQTLDNRYFDVVYLPSYKFQNSDVVVFENLNGEQYHSFFNKEETLKSDTKE